MAEADYRRIVAHYERCLAAHADGPRAVDWKSERDATLRYDVMLDLVRPGDATDGAPPRLLDFGCGLGGLKERMDATRPGLARYLGLDISQAFVDRARARHPETEFLCLDIHAADARLPEVDYVVMNGVFTRSEGLGEAAMLGYLAATLDRCWPQVRRGLAFNVMSDHVDWTSDMLFHAPTGAVADLLAARLSRHLAMRSDYGLHETTWYVYRAPTEGSIRS